MTGMRDSGAWIAGEIADWPDMDRMAALLRDAGLRDPRRRSRAGRSEPPPPPRLQVEGILAGRVLHAPSFRLQPLRHRGDLHPDRVDPVAPALP